MTLLPRANPHHLSSCNDRALVDRVTIILEAAGFALTDRISTASTFVLLPGWPDSADARAELNVALHTHLPILYWHERDATLIDMSGRVDASSAD